MRSMAEWLIIAKRKAAEKKSAAKIAAKWRIKRHQYQQHNQKAYHGVK